MSRWLSSMVSIWVGMDCWLWDQRERRDIGLQCPHIVRYGGGLYRLLQRERWWRRKFACSRAETFPEGGWGACGYLSLIRRSYSAMFGSIFEECGVWLSSILGFGEGDWAWHEGWVGVGGGDHEFGVAILFSMVCWGWALLQQNLHLSLSFAAIVLVWRTVYLKCRATSWSACCRMSGGMPSSIIVMCGEVKQCSVRCNEWMRVRSTASICASMIRLRRFLVVKPRTQGCHMQKRT